MNTLITIGKALTWLSLIAAAICILCIAVLGCADMSYEVMVWFYGALSTAFVLLFLAGAMLALTPDQPQPNDEQAAPQRTPRRG